MPSLGYVSFFGLKFAILIYGVVWFSVAAGHGAALNESVDYPEVRNELSNIDEEVRQNMTTEDGEQYSGAQVDVLLSVVTAVVTPAVDFGYEHTTAAWWYLRTSPFVVGGGLLAYAYGTYSKWRRGEL